MGFDFPDNFKTPYFSKNFSEFWTRWHISLSSWLRDYLYIPLGGSRGGSFGSYFFILIFMILAVVVTGWWWLIIVFLGLIGFVFYKMRQSEAEKVKMYTYMNNMVTMLLGGLWHGASYAFIFWGFLHGGYLIVQRLLSPFWNKFLNTIRTPMVIQNLLAILIVYFATCFAWIYFRAPDFEIASQVINGIYSLEGFSFGTVINKFVVLKGFILIGMLVGVEIIDLRNPFFKLTLNNPYFRVASFAVLLWLIAFFGTFGSNSFIYFQF